MESKPDQKAEEFQIQYYDGHGRIKTGLFSSIAEEIGMNLANKKSRKIQGGKELDISTTQVRRFFDDVKVMQRYIEQFKTQAERETAFDKKLPEIMMLKAKVTYARGRDVVTDYFKDFIDKNIDCVNTLKDFEVFCKFFESVYGFFYYTAQKNAQRKGEGGHDFSGHYHDKRANPSQNRSSYRRQ